MRSTNLLTYLLAPLRKIVQKNFLLIDVILTVYGELR